MKLSEKGVNKILTENVYKTPEGETLLILNDLGKTEFEPDDFKGVVVLTVEEACEILDYLSYLHLRGGKDSFLKELEKCNRNLYERIEQTEEGK